MKAWECVCSFLVRYRVPVMRHAILAFLWSISAVAGLAAAEPARAALPNIVFVLCDDLGYGDPSCYNKASKVPTPHMDRLAGQGMRFTDAHTPSAVCTPTRYGLL